MAKRKLSEGQRENIRKIIRKGLAQKKKTSEILSTVAKRYGITTETGRWYLKSVAKNGRSKPAGKRSRKAPKSKKPKAARRAKPKTKQNGLGTRLFEFVSRTSESLLKQALHAKRLFPKWQAHRRKADSLKKEESRLKKELRTVNQKAKRLERKIKALTSS